MRIDNAKKKIHAEDAPSCRWHEAAVLPRRRRAGGIARRRHEAAVLDRMEAKRGYNSDTINPKSLEVAMKNSKALHRSVMAIMTLALLISACSMKPPSNGVNGGPTFTPTPTSVNGSSNIGSTAEIIPVDTPSPAALTPVPNVDICSLITTAEAEPFVETALIDVTPGGDIDEVTGGPLDYCTYKGDDVALVISLVKSGAPEGSQEWQNLLLLMAQATDPEAGVTPGSDLGERSYWVVTEDSAGWFVAKFPYVFALAVGGNIGYSEDYKEDLKTLAQKVLDSLP